MKFSLIQFSISLVAFLIFADKRKAHQFLPTCYMAVILAFLTDLLIITTPLWEYPSRTKKHLFWIQLMNAFGIYFVTTFLFLQTLPKRQTIVKILCHIFYWSTFAIFIEYIALESGFIRHKMWWNLWWSYLSDWILFGFFYLHHKWIKGSD